MNNSSSKFENWKKGMIAAAPLCLGYIAVAFTFGISAKEVLSPSHAVLMSATSLSSSGQFAALGLILVSAPFWEMAMAQFIINIRYALMSCAISQKLDPNVPVRHRLVIALGITDEVFGIASEIPGKLNVHFLFGMVTVAVPSWVLGTLIGSIAHNFLPQVVVTSLGVAFYGMFIAVIIPPTRKNKVLMAIVLVSMITSALFDLTPVLSGISSGIKIIILTLIISTLAALLFPVHKKSDSNIDMKKSKSNNNNIKKSNINDDEQTISDTASRGKRGLNWKQA